jgi:hypothetical protein
MGCYSNDIAPDSMVVRPSEALYLAQAVDGLFNRWRMGFHYKLHAQILYSRQRPSLYIQASYLMVCHPRHNGHVFPYISNGSCVVKD